MFQIAVTGDDGGVDWEDGNFGDYGDYGGGDPGGTGETAPEIVGAGRQPPVTPLGNSGWTAQFYSDGVAVLRYMGGAPQDCSFTMESGRRSTTSATAAVPRRYRPPIPA